MTDLINWKKVKRRFCNNPDNPPRVPTSGSQPKSSLDDWIRILVHLSGLKLLARSLNSGWVWVSSLIENGARTQGKRLKKPTIKLFSKYSISVTIIKSRYYRRLLRLILLALLGAIATLSISTLSAQPVISSSVEYLHFDYNKAEGRGQRAEGKKEGCKVEGNDNCLSELDIRAMCSSDF